MSSLCSHLFDTSELSFNLTSKQEKYLNIQNYRASYTGPSSDRTTTQYSTTISILFPLALQINTTIVLHFKTLGCSLSLYPSPWPWHLYKGRIGD